LERFPTKEVNIDVEAIVMQQNPFNNLLIGLLIPVGCEGQKHCGKHPENSAEGPPLHDIPRQTVETNRVCCFDKLNVSFLKVPKFLFHLKQWVYIFFEN
jgi:hypothetical protein